MKTQKVAVVFLVVVLALFWSCQSYSPVEMQLNHNPSLAASDETVINQTLEECEFAEFIVRAAHINFAYGNFQLTGTFTLGECTDGIDPANEDVEFEFGEFEQLVLAGSFVVKDGVWIYATTERGGIKAMTIKPLGGMVYWFDVVGSGIDLSETKAAGPEDVVVSLEIVVEEMEEGEVGEDTGETTLDMHVNRMGNWFYTYIPPL